MAPDGLPNLTKIPGLSFLISLHERLHVPDASPYQSSGGVSHSHSIAVPDLTCHNGQTQVSRSLSICTPHILSSMRLPKKLAGSQSFSVESTFLSVILRVTGSDHPHIRGAADASGAADNYRSTRGRSCQWQISHHPCSCHPQRQHRLMCLHSLLRHGKSLT